MEGVESNLKSKIVNLKSLIFFDNSEIEILLIVIDLRTRINDFRFKIIYSLQQPA